jgi:hypothetical protein
MISVYRGTTNTNHTRLTKVIAREEGNTFEDTRKYVFWVSKSPLKIEK